MVGLGTQDTLQEADDFVDQYGLTFTVLWDETFQTWQHFGVAGQPAVALVDGQGELLGSWFGGIPEEEVLRLIGS